ncbi:GIY-YIG nuclease family protein [Immundisolibacter sp.]
MKFFYQLKSINGTGWHDSTLLYTGFIEAADKKEAKAKLDNEFQMKLKERVVLKDGQKPPDYKLYLIQSSDSVIDFYLSERKCMTCSENYIILEQRNLGHHASRETCSDKCRSHNRPKVPEYFDSLDGYRKPVIYRITNKHNGKCYIGKTKQPFTLRWWQHFFHPTDSKFHKAIQESQVHDWSFEIVESIDGKATDEEIALCEQKWISNMDSIANGYNSVPSRKIEEQSQQTAFDGEVLNERC